ncbi:unnamed protein product [Fraxinus pennsylvanica]|uniref:Uncharacterized protein n=1 Tax=Fraxinus pennsylvanica TaxID=56036 RepID=A0AAD1ZVE9_9LAMI|nr:unnamed protein product [Fraxinus pennsylvanica]
MAYLSVHCAALLSEECSGSCYKIIIEIDKLLSLDLKDSGLRWVDGFDIGHLPILVVIFLVFYLFFLVKVNSGFSLDPMTQQAKSHENSNEDQEPGQKNSCTETRIPEFDKAAQRLSSDSQTPVGGTTGNDMFMVDLGQSSSRRATITPIKKLLSEEMSKETDVKRCSSSVIARVCHW